MSLIKTHLREILELKMDLASANNYLDLLSCKDPIELEKNQFWRIEDQAILGISPEGGLNIYCEKITLQEKLLAFGLKKNPCPTLILGNQSLNKLIEKTNLSVTKYNPYDYLQKSPKSALETILEVRVAQTQEDQLLVNRWYQTFNESEGSSWDIPNLRELDTKKLFLAFAKNQFVGGAANTLVNSLRFWLGRLYIFEPFRKQGFADELMTIVENLALQNFQSVDLLVNQSNKAAKNLYSARDYDLICSNAYWVISK